MLHVQQYRLRPSPPDTKAYYCVASALASASGAAGSQIWNTEATDVNTEVSIYNVTAGQQFVDLHTFVVATGSLDTPSNMSANALTDP